LLLDGAQQLWCCESIVGEIHWSVLFRRWAKVFNEKRQPPKRGEKKVAAAAVVAERDQKIRSKTPDNRK
jgi:hypothetical protein